jgi:hypothetical protein
MSNERYKPDNAPAPGSMWATEGQAGKDTVPDAGVPAHRGSSDTLPEQAGIYVPPRPLASISDHRTIEVEPVRLAREIDPRRAPTELRLTPPVRGRSWPWAFAAVLLAALLALYVFSFRDGARPAPLASPASPGQAPAEPTTVGSPVPPSVADPVVAGSPTPGTAQADPAPPRASPPVDPPTTEPVKVKELVPVRQASSAPPEASTKTEPKKGRGREPWLE